MVSVIERPVVSIQQDPDPYNATTRALHAIRASVDASLAAWQARAGHSPPSILVKPNLLSTGTNYLCNTNVRACEAVADFFTEIGFPRIVIAEGTTWGRGGQASTWQAFENHGFAGKAWDLVDLHQRPAGAWFRVASVDPPDGKPIELGLARDTVDAFVVSLAKFKTHDVLGLTLSIKNMMGALVAARIAGEQDPFVTGDVKGFMHGFGNRKPHQLAPEQNTGPSKVALAANLVRMVRCRAPDLAVIDGSTVMEGAGPRRGTSCGALGTIAIAGTDPVAVDATCAAIACIPLDRFQYVLRAGQAGAGTWELDRVAFTGVPWETLRHPVERHPAFATASPWTAGELALLETLL